MDDFETWLSNYPRREAKADARKAWMQTALIRPPMETLITRTMSVCKHWRDEGRERKFIPLPATFLRGERWEDSFEEAPSRWDETCSGVNEMAASLSLKWDERGETFQAFTQRVRDALTVRSHPFLDENVTLIRRTA